MRIDKQHSHRRRESAGGGFLCRLRTVEAVIKDDPECLAMFREAMKERGNNQHTESKPNNVRDAASTCGNSKAYSIDRVKRECEPEVVAKVMSGEMSPNAALVKAGIRENRQVYVPKESAKAVEKLPLRH